MRSRYAPVAYDRGQQLRDIVKAGVSLGGATDLHVAKGAHLHALDGPAL